MKTETRLQKIAAIIQAVDDRCIASDGPVTKTRLEITDAELRTIYRLAMGKPLSRTERLRREQAACRSYEKLALLGLRRGYRFPLRWAQHIMRVRREKGTA